MAQKNKRYQEMERYMTYALIADAVLFVLYLICAGAGIVWLKVILAILSILLSALCLGFLYLSREIFRRRSLWMSVSAGAILLCTLASLLLNFPCPNKYKAMETETKSASVLMDTTVFY